mmetsp:Transcript_16549/g.23513  ORF Transcript_16549/g.23513 Transcript_16549/m.23513 type:complete len:238 (-) Transcript_16549:2002-2715(-)
MHILITTKVVTIIPFIFSFANLLIIILIKSRLIATVLHVRIHTTRTIYTTLIEMLSVTHVVRLATVSLRIISTLILTIVVIMRVMTVVMIVSTSITTSILGIVVSLMIVATMTILVCVMLGLVLIWLTISCTLAHQLLLVSKTTLNTTKLSISIAISYSSLAHLILLLVVKSWVVWHCTVHAWWNGSTSTSPLRPTRCIVFIICVIFGTRVYRSRSPIQASLLRQSLWTNRLHIMLS